MRSVFFLLFVIAITPGQRLLSQNARQFHMAAPENWVKIDNNLIVDNIGKFKLTPSQLDSMMESHKNSLMLYSYTKYKQTEHNGLIPTILVVVKKQSSQSFEKFYDRMAADMVKKKTLFADFEYIDQLQKIQVGGMPAAYFSAKFSMKTTSSVMHPVTRTYLIPDGNVFYQINFTDGDDENCSELFDKLIKTVSIK